MTRRPATLPLLALALAGIALAADAPDQKTTLEAARGEYHSVDNQTFGTFDGTAEKRVTLVGTNVRIVCDHLEVTLVGVGEKPGTGTVVPSVDKFKYLLATGHVLIFQGDREATCGRAEVFPRENKIELTDQPVVVDHGSGFHGAGKKITMFRGERRVVIEEPAIEGPPIKDLGFDPNQKPPAGQPLPK